MSQIINNREYRQKVLKEIITELHNGKGVDEVKERFRELIKDVGPTEIAELEEALIKEGMPQQNIKKLCDVHVALFKESLDDIQHSEEIPGHPVYTFRKENREVEKVIDARIKPQLNKISEKPQKGAAYELLDGLNLLMDLDKHYSRKENLLFPYLEKYEITGPPSVMWGIDDDIRAKIKDTIDYLRSDKISNENAIDTIEDICKMITEMIYKEEKILFPMSLETLTEDEWKNIYEDSDEIGYCLIEPEYKWKPKSVPADEKEKIIKASMPGGNIRFDTGILSLCELNGIFYNLPFDITFVDCDDVVKYFSPGKDRIFTRTKTVIGRKVQFCHPPSSVHVVEKILDDFKNNRRDSADFWIEMNNMFIYIRYIAVRDNEGKYIGTLELTQNIADIKKITGEKRLLDD